MPGPASHGGWRRHMRWARNAAHDAFGSLPAVLNWNLIPILGDGFKLKATSPRYVPETNYGGWQSPAVAIHHQQTVEGDVTTLLYPEVALFLLQTGLLRIDTPGINYQDLYGHVVDYWTPPDARRYYGVTVNTLRLAASGTGDGEVQITMSCVAQVERRASDLAPGDDPPAEADFTKGAYDAGVTLVPFMHGYATIDIDTIVTRDVENWTLTVENNVERGPINRHAAEGIGVIGYAIADRRVITLELTELNNDARFNEAIRDGDLISFEALFQHPAGHILQIQIPRMFVPESDEDGTPANQAHESPRLQATQNAAGVDIIYKVDLGPTTTTLAPLTTTGAPTTTGSPATTTTVPA